MTAAVAAENAPVGVPLWDADPADADKVTLTAVAVIRSEHGMRVEWRFRDGTTRWLRHGASVTIGRSVAPVAPAARGDQHWRRRPEIEAETDTRARCRHGQLLCEVCETSTGCWTCGRDGLRPGERVPDRGRITTDRSGLTAHAACRPRARAENLLSRNPVQQS